MKISVFSDNPGLQAIYEASARAGADQARAATDRSAHILDATHSPTEKTIQKTLDDLGIADHTLGWLTAASYPAGRARLEGYRTGAQGELAEAVSLWWKNHTSGMSDNELRRRAEAAEQLAFYGSVNHTLSDAISDMPTTYSGRNRYYSLITNEIRETNIGAVAKAASAS